MQAWQATVQDEAGNAVVNPSITVYRADGVTLATIYNGSGVSIANPLTGGVDGFVKFWAPVGSYKITVGGNTWDIKLGDGLSLLAISDLSSVVTTGVASGTMASVASARGTPGVGGGMFTYAPSSSAVVDGANIVAAAGGGRWLRAGGGDRFDVTRFGVVPGGLLQSANLQAAVDAAVAAGARHVLFPSGAYDFRGVNFKGVDVVGEIGSSFTVASTFMNNGRMLGVSIEGYAADPHINYVTLPPLSDTGSMTFRVSSTETSHLYGVVVKNPRWNDYVFFEFRKNTGIDVGPWGLTRVQRVLTARVAYAMQSVANGSAIVLENSGFSDVAMQQAYIGSLTGVVLDSSRSYWNTAIQSTPSAAGAFVRLSVASPSGVGNILFNTIGNSGRVNITVDGTVVHSNLLIGTGSSGIQSLRKVEFPVSPGGSEVVVTTVGSAANVRIVGVNAYTPGDGAGMDTFGTSPFYNATLLATLGEHAAYVSSGGASEYAIRVKNRVGGGEGFVGSYHGNEVYQANSLRFVINGRVGDETYFSGNLASPRCGLGCSISQKTLINNELSTEIIHDFGDSYVMKNIAIEGTTQSDVNFVGMSTIDQRFKRVMFPNPGTLDIDADYYYPLGTADGYIIQDPDSKRMHYAKHTPFVNGASNRGGAYIKINPGSYNKLYTAFSNGYEAPFGNIGYQVTHVFN